MLNRRKMESVALRWIRGVRGASLAGLLALGCSGDPGAALEEARRMAGAGDDAGALELVGAVLDEKADRLDPATRLGFERVRLDSSSRLGKGEWVEAELVRLSERYPAQIGAEVHAAAASWLHDAGASEVAVRILGAAEQRFPSERAVFVSLAKGWEQDATLGDAEHDALCMLEYITCR